MPCSFKEYCSGGEGQEGVYRQLSNCLGSPYRNDAYPLHIELPSELDDKGGEPLEAVAYLEIDGPFWEYMFEVKACEPLVSTRAQVRQGASSGFAPRCHCASLWPLTPPGKLS